MHASFMIQIVVISTNCVTGGSQTKTGFMGKLDNSFGLKWSERSMWSKPWKHYGAFVLLCLV